MIRATAFVFFLLLELLGFAQDRIIAITVDDLPCTHCVDAAQQETVLNSIMGTLAKYKAPATGFVNEGKLYDDGKLDPRRVGLLKKWLEAGHGLGNHTYSHIAIDGASLRAYKDDVLKGEQVTRPLLAAHGQRLAYFRHTQLRTGPTVAYRDSLDAFLKAKGYTTAPVSMDNDEYVFAFCYDHARQQGDSAGMRIIVYEYLQYMADLVRHYERLSRDLIGYDMRHTLLLHANQLNADHLDALLQQLEQRGYSFVTLDEALADSAYSRRVGFTPRGMSWLNRWQIAAGETPTEQPVVKERISEQMAHYRSSRKRYPSQTFQGDVADLTAIQAAISTFSSHYVSREFAALAACYTVDGKIMPGGAGIIEGRAAIQEQWTLPEDEVTLDHIITPLEIVVQGDVAYDHGYYEGQSRSGDADAVRWFGKYVIIWKKVDGAWLIHRDIWNRL